MIDHSSQDRRATDNTQEDIRSLILDMPDQKDKAILLILLRMAANLEQNTALTKNVSEKVETQVLWSATHESAEKVLIGKAAGAWYVLSGVIVFALGLSGFFIKGLAEDYKTLGVTVASHTVSIKEIRKDVDLIQELARIKDGVQKGARVEPRP